MVATRSSGHRLAGLKGGQAKRVRFLDDEAYDKPMEELEGAKALERQPENMRDEAQQKKKNSMSSGGSAKSVGSTAEKQVAEDQPAAKKPKLILRNSRRDSSNSASNGATKSPDGETIAVQQKKQDADSSKKTATPAKKAPDDDSDSSLSDIEELDRRANEGRAPFPAHAATGANRSWGRKGKQPVRQVVEDDHEMIDADAEVNYVCCWNLLDGANCLRRPMTKWKRLRSTTMKTKAMKTQMYLKSLTTSLILTPRIKTSRRKRPRMKSSMTGHSVRGMFTASIVTCVKYMKPCSAQWR